MWRPRILLGVSFVCAMTAISPLPNIATRLTATRADDPPANPPNGNAPAQATAPQPRARLDSGQIAKLRAERAQARRAAIALEDNFGPGAAGMGGWSPATAASRNSPKEVLVNP